MLNFKILLILFGCFLTTSAIAGTILLMGIGLGTPGVGPPPVTNFLLLSDGTSYLLLVDGTSKLCLAGGC